MMNDLKIKTIEEFQREGISPEILFWVGCAGSFDDRAKRITKAFVKILNSANISFGVLGKDESCTGDPAKSCLLYTSTSPRDWMVSSKPSSA